MAKNDYRRKYRETLIHFGFGPDLMKQKKVCLICGLTAPSTEKYCSGCGAILPKGTLYDLYKSKHFYCPACDTVVRKSAKFCPECGRRLYRRRGLSVNSGTLGDVLKKFRSALWHKNA